ncbi:hypothetical protein CDAR_239161 [Caerostris darwini]|uniref:Uncharacterized protein n=1 Tax=Caerostris darwini TaxID=1538125 RepID=A0AAV4NYY3_9ARAC|nr:hypothetical protein CDAR_239161 [Caerostris darwini]
MSNPQGWYLRYSLFLGFRAWTLAKFRFGRYRNCLLTSNSSLRRSISTPERTTSSKPSLSVPGTLHYKTHKTNYPYNAAEEISFSCESLSLIGSVRLLAVHSTVVAM